MRTLMPVRDSSGESRFIAWEGYSGVPQTTLNLGGTSLLVLSRPGSFRGNRLSLCAGSRTPSRCVRPRRRFSGSEVQNRLGSGRQIACFSSP